MSQHVTARGQVPAAAMKRYATTLTKDPARDAACGQELRTIRAIVMENCACSHSQRLTNRTCKPRLHSGQGGTVAMQSDGLSFNHPKWRHESHLLNLKRGGKDERS
jgi:hypothetical protein